ncbi:MAG TPA: hypothetical protein VFG54_12350 [Prolixibacteraceae bacterium]|nr:hypothetical protein [Prolixibacteraceae bacterium]
METICIIGKFLLVVLLVAFATSSIYHKGPDERKWYNRYDLQDKDKNP